VWWNPGGIARSSHTEAAIHHSQSFTATGDAVSLVAPFSLLGVVAGSVNILNYGRQDVTDPTGRVVGQTLARNIVYAATFATGVGDRFDAGITYKIVQLRLDCTGACGDTPAVSASTSALDFGVQASPSDSSRLAFGAAVRHVGLPLQVNDKEQADPLPTRIQLGMLYRVAALPGSAHDAEVHLTGDLLDRLRVSRPTVLLGADVAWRRRLHLRGGYVFENSEGAGPSLGLGYAGGNVVFDLARIFEGFSADAGQAPTYFSLRYLF
jgi:hypothetical protein